MARRKFPQMNAILDELDVALVDKHEIRAERARLEAFEAAGGLDGPAYALSPGMDGFDIAPLVEDFAESRALSNLFEHTELKLSNLGQEIVMQGAASIILHHELGVI